MEQIIIEGGRAVIFVSIYTLLVLSLGFLLGSIKKQN